MQFELEGPNYNYRTTGVIHTFTKQVLTEPTLLTFEHVRQRLQRTLVSTAPMHRARVTTVVKQRVHGLLEHAFFVAQNHCPARAARSDASVGCSD